MAWKPCFSEINTRKVAQEATQDYYRDDWKGPINFIVRHTLKGLGMINEWSDSKGGCKEKQAAIFNQLPQIKLNLSHHEVAKKDPNL